MEESFTQREEPVQRPCGAGGRELGSFEDFEGQNAMWRFPGVRIGE